MGNKVTSKDALATGLLLIGSVIWGTVFVVTQIAIDSGLSSTFIMWFKFLIASIILLCLFSKKLRSFSAKEFKCGIIAGFLLFLGFFAQTVGLEYTTPSNNAFITATNVIMVPFITWIVFKQRRPTAKLLIAAFLCFIGVGLLTFSFEKGFLFNAGDALTLLCAVIFACHISYLSISAKRIDVIKLTFLQITVAGIMSLFAFFLFDVKSFTMESFKLGFWPVMYLGAFGTCAAFLAQTFAQKYTSSTKAAIIMSSEALFGSMLSVILGFESFTLNMLIGGMMVIGSVVILEIKFPSFINNEKKKSSMNF